MAKRHCDWIMDPRGRDVCLHCGATDDMECPYEGLDSDLLNIKPTLCVLGDTDEVEQCLSCQ